MDPEKISASKTLVEWIDIYNKKNPWDPFERDNTCALFFRPDKGFCEVLRHSKKPVVASHSCARALCDHSRNLTDEMLHALGEQGGVAGLNFYSRFLRKDSNYATMEQVRKHARHIVNHAGIEALALGSDFDGITCELEWKDYGGMQKLLSYLEQEFSPDELEKICYRNAGRIFEEQ